MRLLYISSISMLSLVACAHEASIGEPVAEYYSDGQAWYTGFMKDSLQQGHWTWFLPDGNKKYEGDYLEGKKHGFGVLMFNDGSTYEVM